MAFMMSSLLLLIDWHDKGTMTALTIHTFRWSKLPHLPSLYTLIRPCNDTFVTTDEGAPNCCGVHRIKGVTSSSHHAHSYICKYRTADIPPAGAVTILNAALALILDSRQCQRIIKPCCGS